MQLAKDKEYRRKKTQAPPMSSSGTRNFYNLFPSKGTTRGKEAPQNIS
jgi:hypothetical protein